jgi:periplasmic protein TonB
VETRDQTPRREEGNPTLFGHLLASRPDHNVRGSLSSTLTSIAVHAVIIAGLIVAVRNVETPLEPAEDVVITTLSQPDAPALPAAPTTGAASVAPVQAPAAFPTLPTPEVVPNMIPLETGSLFKPENEIRAVGLGVRDSSGKPKGTSPDDIDRVPFVTPMDVKPKLLNQSDVERLVSRNYPPLMRDAGITGKTTVWIRVGEDGKPTSWLVKKGSGYDALDSAAVRVAPDLRFTPAQNLGRSIPVWITLDIVFTVR